MQLSSKRVAAASALLLGTFPRAYGSAANYSKNPGLSPVASRSLNGAPSAREDGQPLQQASRHPGNNRVYRECAVTTEIPACSRLGVGILSRGGNAVDAAVASLICVGAINSFSSGLGGGGFLLLRTPSGASEGFNFRESAPGKIREGMYSEHEDVVSGGKAVGVPGELSGMLAAHRKHGRMKWRDLFTETIALLEKGFTVSAELGKRVRKFRAEISRDPGLRSTYVREDGLHVQEGDVIRRKNLAQTLRVLSESPEDFYKGRVARALVDFIRNKRGVIEMADFERYRTEPLDTLHGKAGAYEILTTGLPTSGLLIIKGLLVLARMKALSPGALRTEGGRLLFHHYLVETFKFLFAERDLLGDPRFLEDPEGLIRKLLSGPAIEDIARRINPFRVLEWEEYGLKGPIVEDHGTTHVNVIDKEGMVVAATSTVNTEFGAKIMDPETGIILNNELDDFAVSNFENSYHVKSTSQGNRIKPFKRPFSSASPTIVSGKGMLLAVGAAGGTYILTSVLSVISYVLQEVDLKSAIAIPKMHHQLSPNLLFVEPFMSTKLIEGLQEYGNKVRRSEVGRIFTSTQAILKQTDENGGVSITAISDERKGGDSWGI